MQNLLLKRQQMHSVLFRIPYTLSGSFEIILKLCENELFSAFEAPKWMVE